MGRGLLLGACMLVLGCAGASQGTRATTVGLKSRSAVPPSLNAEMARLGARLARHGLKASGPSLEGFIPSGMRQSFPLDLPARSCMTLVAIATAGVADMDAALYTPDGQLLAADSQPDSHPSIQVCGRQRPARYYYVLHSYDGSGSFLMRAFGGPRESLSMAARELGGRTAVAVNPGLDQKPEDEMQGLSEGLQKRGYRLDGEPVHLELETAQRMRIGLPVEAGHCYAVAAFGRGDLSDLNLRVLDHRGDEVAGDRAPADQAQVQFCAREGAEFAAEAHAVAGSGAAVLLIFHGAAHRVLGHAGLWLGQQEASQREMPTPIAEALAKEESAAVQAGYEKRLERLNGYLQVGQVVEHGIELRAHRCYRFVATAGAGLRALELELVGFREAPPAQTVPGSATVPDVCVEVARAVPVRLTAEQGAGGYALSIYERKL